jgi:hypothetical protein
VEPADPGEPTIDVELMSRGACGHEDAQGGAMTAMSARFEGSFSVAIRARLDARPPSRAAVVSRWTTSESERSFELGIDRAQYPYLAVSEDGSAGAGKWREVRANRQLRLGTEYVVTAIYEPGERMEIVIGDVPVRRFESEVPERVHRGTVDLAFGRRSRTDGLCFPGNLTRALFYERALTAEEAAGAAARLGTGARPPEPPPTRAITRGPDHHWFGYYDKHQFDPSGRFVLGNEVGFEGRAPQADDEIAVGMVDLEDGDRWVELGRSRAWNWQQGCMLQWIPEHGSQVLWNDREGSGSNARFVTRILDVDTEETRTLPRPVYTVAPDGETAMSTDFARLDEMRPGYGYAGIEDPHADENAPSDAGIYRMDLTTGDSELIVSYADAAAIPPSDESIDLSSAKHWFNHILYNPSGTRILFLQRWAPEGGGWKTRLLTARADGSELEVLSDDSGLSHVDWMDDETVLIWTGHHRGYATYRVGHGYEETLLSYRNGHQTVLPGGEWMVTDTYPDARQLQRPFLYHFERDEIVALGLYPAAPGYTGSQRCDLHPRIDRAGHRVVLDSAHDGGRQMYLIDIEDVVGAANYN